MTKNLCSIVIAFYKGADFLENAINSIRKSSYKDLEIIIVDDGTPEEFIPNRYWEHIAQLDPRILIYHKKNGGIADARNFGVSHANGEFIGFFDQDDRIEGDMYTDLVSQMIENHTDFASSNVYHLIFGNKISLNTIKNTGVITKDSIQDIRKWLLMKEVWKYHGEKIDTTIWNCIFRKSVIEKHRLVFYSNLVFDDDWNFLIRYLGACQTAYLSTNAYYIWTVRIDSESHKRRYIKEFPQKYRNHYQFKYAQICSLHVSEMEMQNFREYFFADKLYRILLNESVTVKGIPSYLRAKRILLLVMKEDSSRFSKYGYKQVKYAKGRRAALIYWSIMHHMIPLALLFSKI